MMSGGINILALIIAGVMLPGMYTQAQVSDSTRLPDTQGVRVSADTLIPASAIDTPVKHNPRIATIRSAIIPGWGQATNRKYWKIPIVYTAIGIPVGTFLYNRKWYTRTRDVAKMIANGDTANYRQRVDSKFYIFFDSTIFSSPNAAVNSLTTVRNEFRRNMDYSILFVLLFWGLNIVDATVDAQLRDFDVSNNLSMRIRPTFGEYGSMAGISLSLILGRHPPARR